MVVEMLREVCLLAVVGAVAAGPKRVTIQAADPLEGRVCACCREAPPHDQGDNMDTCAVCGSSPLCGACTIGHPYRCCVCARGTADDGGGHLPATLSAEELRTLRLEVHLGRQRPSAQPPRRDQSRSPGQGTS